MRLPRRGPASPLALGAAVLLAANDHWLKGAHVLPGWLTGKLSDFAGLFLVPVVAAALAGAARHRAVARTSALLAGALFTALKTSPAICAWLAAHHVSVACDPTDLLALPMLALGVFWAAPAPPLPGAGHRLATIGAALACLATSAPRQPMPPAHPSTPVATAPPCSAISLPELEPQGPDAVAHVRVSADPAAPARCNVVLRVTVSGPADAGLAASSTARSAMLVLAPGEALDVAITVPMAYPLRCDAAGTVRVDTHDALDPELPGDAPKASASGPARCAAGLAR